jgi:hypothetical protein
VNSGGPGHKCNGGGKMRTSSDLAISNSVRAVFKCDGDTVEVEFLVNDTSASSDIYTRVEAIRIGAEIAARGSHARFPISGVDVNDLLSTMAKKEFVLENASSKSNVAVQEIQRCYPRNAVVA